MPNQARYIASNGEVVELDGPTTWIGTAEQLLSDQWSYTLGYRDITGVTREAREIEVEAFFRNNEESNRLRRLRNMDVRNGTPGTIEAKGLIQRAYIVKSTPSVITRTHHREALTVVLLDGLWGEWFSEEFWPIETDQDTEYLDLPTDVQFDVMPPSALNSLTNNSSIPAPFKMTIFGPCVNPYIVIGDNRYEIIANIPAGARVEINSQSFPRTITLISSAGDRTDLFSSGTRGSGEGSGEYIFEPLKPGYNSVSWPGGFGFDLEWYEQVEVPEW